MDFPNYFSKFIGTLRITINLYVGFSKSLKWHREQWATNYICGCSAVRSPLSPDSSLEPESNFYNPRVGVQPKQRTPHRPHLGIFQDWSRSPNFFKTLESENYCWRDKDDDMLVYYCTISADAEAMHSALISTSQFVLAELLCCPLIK